MGWVLIVSWCVAFPNGNMGCGSRILPGFVPDYKTCRAISDYLLTEKEAEGEAVGADMVLREGSCVRVGGVMG